MILKLMKRDNVLFYLILCSMNLN